MLLLVLAVVCVLGADAAKRCPEHTLGCRDRCLREDFRCDGKVDCDFAEDEYDCESCKPGAFRCQEKVKTSSRSSSRSWAWSRSPAPRFRCFAEYRRCDENQDCLDGSDEAGCPATTQALLVCSGSPFRGTPFRSTLQSAMVECDGRVDCPGFRDEMDCTEPHQCLANHTFFCDRTCHALARWCDQKVDCSDHSDEANCVFTTPTSTTLTSTTPTSTTPTSTTPTSTTATETSPSTTIAKTKTSVQPHGLSSNYTSTPATATASATALPVDDADSGANLMLVLGVPLLVLFLVLASTVLVYLVIQRNRRGGTYEPGGDAILLPDHTIRVNRLVTLEMQPQAARAL